MQAISSRRNLVTFTELARGSLKGRGQRIAR